MKQVKNSEKVQNSVSGVSTHAYKFEDPRNQSQMLLPGRRTHWETDGEDDLLFTTDLIFFVFTCTMQMVFSLKLKSKVPIGKLWRKIQEI